MSLRSTCSGVNNSKYTLIVKLILTCALFMILIMNYVLVIMLLHPLVVMIVQLGMR